MAVLLMLEALDVSLDDGLAALGGYVLAKTRRGGYDGKGQAWLERASDADRIFAELAAKAGKPGQ